MRAIEFTAKIKNGVIHIPEKYKKLANQLARIIVLTEEDKYNSTGQNLEAIQSVLAKLKERKVFREIKDPVLWQR